MQNDLYLSCAVPIQSKRVFHGQSEAQNLWNFSAGHIQKTGKGSQKEGTVFWKAMTGKVSNSESQTDWTIEHELPEASRNREKEKKKKKKHHSICTTMKKVIEVIEDGG